MPISSKIIKNSSVFLLSTIFSKAVPFFLQPILTRLLTPEDYGLISIFQVLTSIMIPLILLGNGGAITKQYFNLPEKNYSSYFGSAIILTISSTLIWLLLFFLFKDSIAQISGFPSSWIIYIPIFGFFNAVFSYRLILWQVKNKIWNYSLYSIGLTILDFSVTLFLIILLDFDWKGRVVATIFAYGILAILGFVLLYRSKTFILSLKREHLSHLFKFGAPLVPHLLCAWVINASDRFFIINMVSLEALGVYTIGYQIGMIVGFVQDAFHKAWQPWLYKQLENDSYALRIKLVRYTYLYCIVILGIAFFLGFIAPWFIKFYVDKAFWQASDFVVWVGIGYAFNGMYKMVSTYYFYLEKTGILALFTFGAAIVNLVLNYFLITIFGAVGAAQATAISFLCHFLAVWIYLNQIYPLPWKDALKFNFKL